MQTWNILEILVISDFPGQKLIFVPKHRTGLICSSDLGLRVFLVKAYNLVHKYHGAPVPRKSNTTQKYVGSKSAIRFGIPKGRKYFLLCVNTKYTPVFVKDLGFVVLLPFCFNDVTRLLFCVDATRWEPTHIFCNQVLSWDRYYVFRVSHNNICIA